MSRPRGSAPAVRRARRLHRGVARRSPEVSPRHPRGVRVLQLGRHVRPFSGWRAVRSGTRRMRAPASRPGPPYSPPRASACPAAWRYPKNASLPPSSRPTNSGTGTGVSSRSEREREQFQLHFILRNNVLAARETEHILAVHLEHDAVPSLVNGDHPPDGEVGRVTTDNGAEGWLLSSIFGSSVCHPAGPADYPRRRISGASRSP